MRNQEQQDDEERKQRREEDIRAGRIRAQPPRVQPIHNHFLGEIDGVCCVESCNSTWGETVIVSVEFEGELVV